MSVLLWAQISMAANQKRESWFLIIVTIKCLVLQWKLSSYVKGQSNPSRGDFASQVLAMIKMVTISSSGINEDKREMISLGGKSANVYWS